MVSDSSLTVEEKWRSLFQPDSLMSDQFYCRRKILEGEKRLQLAVLADAIELFLGIKKGKHLEKDICDAEEWIWDERSDSPFSFNAVCESLDFDLGYLRRGLSSLREKKLKGEVVKLTQRKVVKRRYKRVA